MRPYPLFICAVTVLCMAVTSAKANDDAPTPEKPVTSEPARAASDVSASVRATERAPYEVVRSMHALQDQMVLGNFGAQAALPAMSARIAERMLAASPEVWREPINVRAVVNYVLDGGQVRVARKVLQSPTVPAFERKLIEGAIAYVEGNEVKARQLLLDIDARKLPGPLGAHLAFVQGVLIPKAETAKIRRALDLARLLAPGTLIEEAALRREIILVDDKGDIEAFMKLCSQYVRRYRHSIYADNFRQHFTASLLRLGVLGNNDRFMQLDRVLTDIQPASERLDLYLLIAQAALVNGNIPVARTSAGHAATLAEAKSNEAYRAAVYEAAAQVLSGERQAGLAKLSTIEISRLAKRDADLVKAVMVMADRIEAWPKASEVDTRATSVVAGSEAPAENKAATVIDVAQKALADTDGLLAR